MGQEEALVALVKRYRMQHPMCRVVTWQPDTKGFTDISADARCPICKKADALLGDEPKL